MPRPKIAISLASFRLPLREAIIAAGRLGAAGIEIDARHGIKPQELTQTAARQMLKWLDDSRLVVSSLSFVTRRGYNVPDELDRRIEATRQAMQMARSLRASILVNHVGRLPASDESDEWKLLVEVLTDLGRYGQRVGVMLAAQASSDSPTDMARLLAALPAGTLAVSLDPGGLVRHELSPLEAVETLGPHLVHVYANDAVRDSARGRTLEVELGRGAVDYPALLGALEEQDYRGSLTIAREMSAITEPELAAAMEFLQAVVG